MTSTRRGSIYDETKGKRVLNSKEGRAGPPEVGDTGRSHTQDFISFVKYLGF